jgi:hypothetical protein
LRLGIEAVRCVDDRGDLGMEHRTSGEKDAVLTTPDDLAVLHDHGPEWPAPALLDRFDGQPRRFFHEFAFVHLGRRFGECGWKRGCRDRGGNGGLSNERAASGVLWRIANISGHDFVPLLELGGS